MNKNNKTLLPVDRARAVILRHARAIKAEPVNLEKACGRILRTPVKADRDLPPFNRSAMDGFALRTADARGKRMVMLDVCGEAAAGSMYVRPVPRGACIRIMTGAPVPKGLDAVVPVELSRPLNKGKCVELDVRGLKKNANIHRQGSDARKGRVLVKAGHRITATALPTLASIGIQRPMVSRTIRLALMPTGQEVIPVARKPKPAQIRESNMTTLDAWMAAQHWLKATKHEIAPDQPTALRKRLAGALASCDVLLTSGGVSAGAYDLLPDTFASLGVKAHFHKVAIKPGKPLWFGSTKKGQLVFGLPGNPVSTWVTFFEFVLPALRKMAGCKVVLPIPLRLPLGVNVAKRNNLTQFTLCRTEMSGACSTLVPVRSMGSGDFFSMHASDGVFVFPPDKTSLSSGTVVEFHPWA